MMASIAAGDDAEDWDVVIVARINWYTELFRMVTLEDERNYANMCLSKEER